MLIGHPRQKVYLAVGATDMRNSVDGLTAIVQLDFDLNPFEPCLFALCNRQRNRVKILEWSERGFWLHYFRLEKGRLPWPQVGDEVNPLDVSWQDLRPASGENAAKAHQPACCQAAEVCNFRCIHHCLNSFSSREPAYPTRSAKY